MGARRRGLTKHEKLELQRQSNAAAHSARGGRCSDPDNQQWLEDMVWMQERGDLFGDLILCWGETKNDIYLQAARQLYADGLASKAADERRAKPSGVTANPLSAFVDLKMKQGLPITTARKQVAAECGIEPDSTYGDPLTAAAKKVERAHLKEPCTIERFAALTLAAMRFCRKVRKTCDVRLIGN